MIYFKDLGSAIHFAYTDIPCCIAYREKRGWFVYSPMDGCPKDSVPELFLPKQGHLPIPLSKEGGEALFSLIHSALANGVIK
jgi:hypothetical protein